VISVVNEIGFLHGLAAYGDGPALHLVSFGKCLNSFSGLTVRIQVMSSSMLEMKTTVKQVVPACKQYVEYVLSNRSSLKQQTSPDIICRHGY